MRCGTAAGDEIPGLKQAARLKRIVWPARFSRPDIADPEFIPGRSDFYARGRLRNCWYNGFVWRQSMNITFLWGQSVVSLPGVVSFETTRDVPARPKP